MFPHSTDVLIVGAGPTGLALAIALQQAGVDYLLVEKLPHGRNTSRAAVIHAHTLEMLGKIGVVEELTRRGLVLSRFTVRDRDHALLGLNFDKLPTAYPQLLMLPQHETEDVLNQRLSGLGGTVHWGTAVSAIDHDGERQAVHLFHDGSEQVVSARYVVGADGMHSIVRERAGLGFDGESYSESFVLADVFMDWSLGRDEVSLFFSPAGMVVVAPLPDGSFRIVATLENAPEKATIADIQAILEARGPTQDIIHVKEVLWTSRFRLHDKVATAYRNNGFLLMGDAAHVHSPAGGQGMNTGLVDSIVLGELLTNVLKKGRPVTDLDQYETLRRPAAIEVVALAGRLTRLATAHSGISRSVRNFALRVLDNLPPVKRKLELALSGIDRRAFTRISG